MRPPAPLPWLALALQLLLSVLLGVVTGGLGAALPLLRDAYDMPAASGTELVVLYNLGALASIALCGPGRGQALSRRAVTVLLAAFVGGCAGMASAPTWPALNVCAAVCGAGYGGLVLHQNTLLGRYPGRAGLVSLNLLHASFGAGAVLGPVLVGGLRQISGLLLATAALAAALTPWAGAGGSAPGTAEAPGAAEAAAAPVVAVPPAPGRFLAILGLAALAYAGIESSIGALESTHLHAIGHSPADAARLSGLFWAGLVVGRLALPFTAARLAPPRMVLLCLLAGAAGLVTAAGGWAAGAYAVTGVALGPVFSTLLAWANATLLVPRRVSTVLLLGNLCGSGLLPYLIGLVADPRRPALIPLSIAALTLLTGVAVAVAARLARAAEIQPAPRPHGAADQGGRPITQKEYTA
ncbi:MFS transporter [Sorangium sp. So ce1151]|uniref:MFS transporter n=1 Tax=Sorangium sp. So ce1151 TaxID=3133332 RepID=UPI003F5D5F17